MKMDRMTVLICLYAVAAICFAVYGVRHGWSFPQIERKAEHVERRLQQLEFRLDRIDERLGAKP